MANLTKDDAFHFLDNVLKIEHSSARFVQMNKLDLLNTIIPAWHKCLPFQNVTQLCLTRREHRLPTVQEIVADQMAGRGGVCIYHAVFCHLLLSALEYKAKFIVGQVSELFDHVVVVVEDVVKPGDLYLVEVGCGYSTKEAVPLDFTSQTEYEYSYCGLEYKYVKQGSSIIRFHGVGDDTGRNVQLAVGKWRRFYDFDIMGYRGLAFLFSDEAGIKRILIDLQSRSWFMTQVRAVRFTESGTIAIKENVLLQYSSEERSKTVLDEKKKLTEAFEQFFPMLDKSSVLEAIEYARSNAESLI